MADLRDMLGRVEGKRILVVGDLYLDRYIFGHPDRISREAPIMVLQEDRQEDRLGGGAAPALALAVLYADVAVAGVVGDDDAGRSIRHLLQASGIGTDGVIVDSARPTTTKTRVVAEGFLLFPQQIVRVDRQLRAAVAPAVEADLVAAIAATTCDAVLISDYRSGVVTERVVAAVRDAQTTRGILATVDSQGELSKFAGFDLVKCNQGEAEAVLGHPLGDREARAAAITRLAQTLDCQALVVTRGSDGASLATPTEYAEIPPANRSEIYDVTGAGDTVVAVMAAALLAGGTALEAAYLAQAAAGIVVRKWGNAQATRDEINASLGMLLPEML